MARKTSSTDAAPAKTPARNPLYDDSLEQTADWVACALTYLQVAETAIDQDGGGQLGDDAVMGRQLLMRACSAALLAHSRAGADHAV